MSPPNEPKSPQRHIVRNLKRAGLVAAAVAAIIIANGVIVRLDASNALSAVTTEEAIPTVRVVKPGRTAGAEALTLPGTLQAYYSAPIYARVPGYVRQWYKDIGAQVHRGDLLAEIDTPELDQQIAQAKADYANAEAARDLSQSTAARWTNLVAVDAVSKQEAEEKTGDLAAKAALVDAAKANVDRLTTMKTFARITAPFDGVVTERSVDIGALVNAGAGTSGSALFTIADIHKLRAYVRVPQNYSAEIRPPMTAQLSLPEYPGQTFPATLLATSNAISDQSNTLLVEFEAANPDGKLKPGAYAQVSVTLPENTHVVSIPSSALMFRSDGLHVATVGEKNRVVMKTVTIGQDLGTEIEISAGLGANDRIIDSPPDSLVNGDLVRLADADAAAPAKGR